MSTISAEELAEEFEADADSLERLAEGYRAKGMDVQYQILWHEAVTYRRCADRVNAAIRNALSEGERDGQ